MKTRFTTLDIVYQIQELERLVGCRVNQVYDVDSKTYLLKLHRLEEKVTLLLESGIRFHLTTFERSKNPAPSGFSMKLRKHINNKRLEGIRQLNRDRVVEFTFGSGDHLHRLILELYDKGNMVLTDGNYLILNILRPRLIEKGNPLSDKLVVKEHYPIVEEKEENNQQQISVLTRIESAKPSDPIKRILVSSFAYGPALLEHFLLLKNIPPNTKLKDITTPSQLQTIQDILHPSYATDYLSKKDSRVPIILIKMDGDLKTYTEFHPFIMEQHKRPDKSSSTHEEFTSFDEAIDEFFSKIESQKIDLKTLQKEKLALKKLDNVKRDHVDRISKLQVQQGLDRRKGELIELNSKLVEKALKVLRSSLANQMSWKEIGELVEEAAGNGDPVARRICKLKLETNTFTLRLEDPYSHTYDSEDEETQEYRKEHDVDINLDLSAQANARSYYAQKKAAAVKEVKTMESHSIALKSAERKTKATLKEVATISTIIKARKTFWFEKFYWFISSENYLVIAGRDMQQNELIFKRYMKSNDLYVHADLHGATSVIIKNPTGTPVPPKTLNEAGTMAVCYSAAWDSKMVTNAWWVHSSQVSKSAPTGEYLSTGSFVVRGKKNFLPPCYLVLGFGILFKLEESSIPRHKDERKVRTIGEEEKDIQEEEEEEMTEITSENEEETEESTSLKEEENEEGTEKSSSLKEEENEDPQEESDRVNGGSEEEEDGDMAFPDTKVDIGYSLKGEMKVQIHPQGSNEENKNQFSALDATTTLGDKTSSSHNFICGERKAPSTRQIAESSEDAPQNSVHRRGKKGKMKKLKEKYKNQDSDEKELRMRLLQERSKEGLSKKQEKKNASLQKEAAKAAAKQRAKERQERKNVKPTTTKQGSNPRKEGNDEEEEKLEDLEADFEDKVNVADEVDMLDSLTGLPVEEDELLFCIPVVAPYQVMTNYKFKVKATPGTSKKGKATKTALNIFSLDKSCSNREKDLLKSMKDQDLARNLPGKIKLSGQQALKKQGKK